MAIAAMVVCALADHSANGQAPTPLPPSAAKVMVNSQKSLAAAVGDGFVDETWAYPKELLPRELAGLQHVSGPAEAGPSKGDWRKPVVVKDRVSGVELFVNCFRRMDAAKRESMKVKPGHPGTPWLPLTEPDYQYKPAAFHELHAATATDGDRQVFAFRDGDILYKIEAVGGKSESRRDASTALAESIWKFRRAK